MATVNLSNGKSFEAIPGMSILEAATRAELSLEHSCKTGRCGTCKARVIAGDVQRGRYDTALTPAERSAGWALTCIDSITNDVRLDITDLALPRGVHVRMSPCRIDALSKLAPDVLEVVVRLPPGAPLRYVAGQHVDVIGRGGVRRSYSIANAPSPSGLLSFHIRQVPDGQMSAYWFERASVGDLLRLEGPLGTFLLRDCVDREVVFLATGTGIAPIRAMLSSLETLPRESRPRRVSLFWGGRTPADHYWTPEQHGFELEYTPVLSRGDAQWTGARGHVQDVLLSARSRLEDVSIYACGSPLMIESTRRALLLRRHPAAHFHADAFVSSEPTSAGEAS